MAGGLTRVRHVPAGLIAAGLCLAVAASSGSQIARSETVAASVSPQARALLTALEQRGAAKAFGQLYVGHVSGQPHLFVALGRKGNTAIAYVCDGRRVGTWFTGSSAAGKKLTLVAADGSTLRGSTAPGTPRFVMTRNGYSVAAKLRLATGRDIFVRIRVAPPYESVGGIIGIRGVLRGLTSSTPTSGGTAPPPAGSPSVTLSGPGLTLTSESFSKNDECAALAAQYEAQRRALESELMAKQIESNASATQLTRLRAAKLALVQRQLRDGALNNTDSARLAQLEVEIAALQVKSNDLSIGVEKLKGDLAALAKSYNLQRRKLGCP